MKRKGNLFKQGDLTRACRGLANAGLAVARVRIDKDGVIEHATGAPEGTMTGDLDLDDELATFEAKHARSS